MLPSAASDVFLRLQTEQQCVAFKARFCYFKFDDSFVYKTTTDNCVVVVVLVVVHEKLVLQLRKIREAILWIHCCCYFKLTKLKGLKECAHFSI